MVGVGACVTSVVVVDELLESFRFFLRLLGVAGVGFSTTDVGPVWGVAAVVEAVVAVGVVGVMGVLRGILSPDATWPRFI